MVDVSENVATKKKGKRSKSAVKNEETTPKKKQKLMDPTSPTSGVKEKKFKPINRKDAETTTPDGKTGKKEGKVFKKDGKSFKKEGKPFKKEGKSFKKDGKSFNKEGKIFKLNGDESGKSKTFVKSGGKAVELLNKKETREKQKKMKEFRRKTKHENVFELGVQAKKVWEEVRRDDCEESKKEKLIVELHSLVKGNIKKLIFAHDTVRVVECLMALGTPDIRDKLFAEMKDDILEMTKSEYAHFFVIKMLKYGSKPQKAIIQKAFEGKVAKLMKNKTAGNVVEMVYNEVANGPQRISMMQEFLDHEFTVFKEPELRTVVDVIEKHPNRKSSCIKNLHQNVEILIRKGAYNHSLVHNVINNYLMVADQKHRAETIEQLRESLVHMVHSREGALAALRCVWHGTTKDRKAIVKSFKTFMQKTAQEEYGHMLLLGFFDCVDDTKLIGNAVIKELLEDVTLLFQNKYAVRVLKYLFCGRNTVYINKDLINILEKGDGNEHSKKDQETRHKELLSTASSAVLKHISENFPNDMLDPPTTISLTCVINNSPAGPDLDAVFECLAQHVTKIPAEEKLVYNVMDNNKACAMMIKKIIFKDAERLEKGENTFSSFLMAHLLKDNAKSWEARLKSCCNCFLIVHLLDSKLDDVITQLTAKLKPHLSMLGFQDNKGASVLSTKLQTL